VGGRVGFSLDAGKGNANRFYWIVMGLSGRSPGTSLPGGRVTLPLNWDAYTVFSIHLVNSFMFVKFMGSLDRNGAAGAIFNLPPIPGAGGQAATFAFALVDGWDYVSNAVPINIVH